ncbi:MAG: rhomboid family intramembrane serine protease [Alphaproteobacteria bacterium]|nr:rhomboid family intramembrane serine protease [Alphaproteobacteria bacterium]
MSMALLQSSPPREPFLHAPASVLWLIAVLAGVHIARLLLPPGMSEAMLENYAFDPSVYQHGGSLLALAVPFVSHIFLHDGFAHLGANCLWLLVFGPVVARRFGPVFFYAFFLVCGVLGAAAYLAVNWGSPGGVIGASGAISGLMGAAIRLFPWPGQKHTQPLAPLLSRQVVVFSGFWFLTNLLLALTGFGAPGEMHQVAWQVHIGGYVAGLLLVGPFDSLHRLRTSHTIASR